MCFKRFLLDPPLSQAGQLCLCATSGFDSEIFLENAAQQKLK